VGAELFHAEIDRQTNITKLIVAFRNFANAPKSSNLCLFSVAENARECSEIRTEVFDDILISFSSNRTLYFYAKSTQCIL
jgi:hypothetical protein